jgi:hypothetical protein
VQGRGDWEGTLVTGAITKLRDQVGQKIPRLLWKQKVHYFVQKSTPLDPILSHMNSVNIITPIFRSILIFVPIFT